ncbi:hypothetical protein NHX12_012771, partial [Muraenolepis orangiensis]
MPSVKAQMGDSASLRAPEPAPGASKSKKESQQVSRSAGDSTAERHQQTRWTRAQPLNLSQLHLSVQQPLMSAEAPAHLPAARLPGPLPGAALFSAAPGLYAYPASAALASVSQTVDQMQGGSSRHARAGE